MIIIKPVCREESVKCAACGMSIWDNHWRLLIQINDKTYTVHDNEGVCRDKLLVAKKLIKPTFLASRQVW